MTKIEEWENESQAIALLRKLEDLIHEDVRAKRSLGEHALTIDMNAVEMLQAAIRQKKVHMAYLGSEITRETARRMQ